MSILSAFVNAPLIGSLLTIGHNDVSANIKENNETAELLKQFSRYGSTKECCTENNTFASSINVDIGLDVQNGTKAGGRQ